ncbi:MAG: HlyD family efflux transporter periplasmic adaptor subunit [Thermoguttaceae bacterium]|nr:HlyD family efflux transporter periplasmic adaptor subunit [Thermoguttaceae bacterium]
MSSEQKLDPTLLEQTKQQIRSLVSEISQISKADISPEEFQSQFLPRVITALAAVGGAIWTVGPNGQLALGYQVNLQQAHLHDDEEANKQHSRLLYQMLRSSESGALVPPHSGTEGPDEAGNPTGFLAIFGMIKTELETVGLIEVFQRPETNPATQKGYLRFLQQMTALATDFYKNRQLKNFGDRQSLWTQLEDFTRNIHKTLDLRETEYTVANEARRLIECDRVSIAIKRGRKAYIEAVSGQDMVDKRSTTVKLLGKLATAVIACNEPIVYTGDTADFAPQVEEAVEEYVDESHTKMVAVYPLIHQDITVGDFDETERDKMPTLYPFGAIIVEQIEDNRVPERMQKRVEIVVQHARGAIGNALDHNSVFLMPVWKAIGKSKVLVSARMLPKTISVTAGILLLLFAMWLVPWNFNMHCQGTLEPETRRNIFAREEGKVDEIFVQHGSQVYGPGADPAHPEGTLLLRLTNSQLEADLEKALGDLAEVQKQISSLKESGFRSERLDDRIRINGQLAQYEVRERSLKTQLGILQERSKELEIRSPISGTVMTFDLGNKLQGRPVQPGQVLMEIAEPDGKLILELDMPERRIGYVTSYEEELKKKNNDVKLTTVHFVMMVDSTKTFSGKIIEEHDRAENRGDSGTTVRLKASIDDPDSLPESKRAGAGVSAKIYCGKKPLGFVLFHEVGAYLQKTVFFWFK